MYDHCVYVFYGLMIINTARDKIFFICVLDLISHILVRVDDNTSYIQVYDHAYFKKLNVYAALKPQVFVTIFTFSISKNHHWPTL